ncbi:MAG TPA: hypothetical protein VG245_08180 [Candidatus Dormibacteraeota bacterium]|jgi:hypothetical protein|nr:hypothetical protein [Candidatus Dormibacteraeota bacterium]
MKRDAVRLHLHRETVRELRGTDLDAAHAGIGTLATYCQTQTIFATQCGCTGTETTPQVCAFN